MVLDDIDGRAERVTPISGRGDPNLADGEVVVADVDLTLPCARTRKDREPGAVDERGVDYGDLVSCPAGTPVVRVEHVHLQRQRCLLYRGDVDAVRTRKALDTGQFRARNMAGRWSAHPDVDIPDVVAEDAVDRRLHEVPATVVGARHVATTGLPGHPDGAVRAVDRHRGFGRVGLAGRRDLGRETGRRERPLPGERGRENYGTENPPSPSHRFLLSTLFTDDSGVRPAQGRPGLWAGWSRLVQRDGPVEEVAAVAVAVAQDELGRVERGRAVVHRGSRECHGFSVIRSRAVDDQRVERVVERDGEDPGRLEVHPRAGILRVDIFVVLVLALVLVH